MPNLYVCWYLTTYKPMCSRMKATPILVRKEKLLVNHYFIKYFVFYLCIPVYYMYAVSVYIIGGDVF